MSRKPKEPTVVDEKIKLVMGAAFPMYHVVASRAAVDQREDEAFAGRVIHLFPQGEPFSQGAFDAGLGDPGSIADSLGADDVLWVPLYHCGVHKRIEHLPAPPAEFYQSAIDLLQAVAPLVKAVMIGNMGPELCWFNRDKTFCPRVLPFVRDTALLVRDFGGRPAYGTVDWDLLVDCYKGGGQMQEAMLEVDALQVCYCGYTVAEGTHYDHTSNLHADQSGFITRNDKGREKLAAYLAPLDIWSGVNFIDGMKAGNDKALHDLGFKAGIIG